MGRDDGIDVYELFFIASVRGNTSMGISVIFEKSSVCGNMSMQEEYQRV